MASCGNSWLLHVDLAPWPGLEPRPLNWKHRVLATGPPWKLLADVLKQLIRKFMLATVTPFWTASQSFCSSITKSCPTRAYQAPLSFTISWSLCPLSQWCYPTISSSAAPFSSCPQSFPAQALCQWVGSLPQVAKVLELQLQHQSSNEYSGLISFRIDWFLISLGSKGLWRVFSSSTVWKHQFFGAQPSLWSNSHIHTWVLEKTVALAIQTFVDKVVSLLLNMLSRFVIAFLPRSKHLWN